MKKIFILLLFLFFNIIICNVYINTFYTLKFILNQKILAEDISYLINNTYLTLNYKKKILNQNNFSEDINKIYYNYFKNNLIIMPIINSISDKSNTYTTSLIKKDTYCNKLLLNLNYNHKNIDLFLSNYKTCQKEYINYYKNAKSEIIFLDFLKHNLILTENIN